MPILDIISVEKTIYKQLESIWLSWKNDYLTCHAFSLDHGLTDNEGFRLIQGLKKMFDE